MTTTAFDRFEVKIFRIPVWALPIAAAAAVALIALAGVFSFGLLLLMSPIILVAGAIHHLKHRHRDRDEQPLWPTKDRPARPTGPLVIDGEYEVIDEGIMVPDPMVGPKPGGDANDRRR